MLRKLLSAAGLASLAAALTQAVPAAACGSLIAPNGSVRLTHAATLVAWHDGVEHYLTNFSYAGNVPDVGYIIPLPAVPVEPVKEGGDWTLQRLFRETHPAPLVLDFFAAGHGKAAASSGTKSICARRPLGKPENASRFTRASRSVVSMAAPTPGVFGVST